MKRFTRREVLQGAGLSVTSMGALNSLPVSAENRPVPDWVRTLRILNAEGYNAPFYPAYTYDAERAVRIARELNASAFRYPAAAYYAYYPTKTKYPVHPDLKSGDPMRQTIDLCRKAGLKTIAYFPLNHPFMNVESRDPNYLEWAKRDASGKPMTTSHYGFGRYYEGCLNSPLREEIFGLVREVVTRYDCDIAYFDGPYQGMQNEFHFCVCRHCQAAYWKARGKEIPAHDARDFREDFIEYTLWMREVVIGTLREVAAMVRRERDIPVLYNDTSLLGRRSWRARAFPHVDGFMFESAETPQQKLFNLQLGQSTGKIIWTYMGHHTQYNREHMKDKSVRGWYSYPIDGEEVLLDGAIASATGAGIVLWGLSRFDSVEGGPLRHSSGRYMRQVFDFSAEHDAMRRTAQAAPQAGVLVGAQTIDWYEGEMFVSGAYPNCFHGAYRLLNDNGFEAEPFLDFAVAPNSLRKYPLIWAPNAVCLSDEQCTHLAGFVADGGTLIATHLTSLADEYGRRRKQPGLAELFGIRLTADEPIERPDLYLRIPGHKELIPQDPQIIPFEAGSGSTILAETWDGGHLRSLGPAVVSRTHGRGRVIYIGSSLEAVYEETRLASLRAYSADLLDPFLGPSRRYRIAGYRPGLMTHFRRTPGALYLHLFADTGDRVRISRARESFLPIPDVEAMVRLPEGRHVKSIRLLRAGQNVAPRLSGPWVKVKIPQVLIHEVIEVQLA